MVLIPYTYIALLPPPSPLRLRRLKLYYALRPPLLGKINGISECRPKDTEDLIGSGLGFRVWGLGPKGTEVPKTEALSFQDEVGSQALPRPQVSGGFGVRSFKA